MTLGGCAWREGGMLMKMPRPENVDDGVEFWEALLGLGVLN